MGVSMSTLGGWSIILCIAGYYAFRHIDNGRKREAARAAAHKHRLEDRQNIQSRKDNKDKAKRQRGESYSKEADDLDKAGKPKPRTSKPAAPAKPAVPAKPAAPAKQVSSYSSDEDVDNREFARQLASIKQGTNFAGPKKGEEKRQKSVKQSRAQEQEEKPSPPSSTAGADADDDQSPIASPEVHASAAADVSDMLERPSEGPSVLRLTDTDKTTKKEKKAKAPEKVESKKQRQNRQKVEAAKVAREEAENDRKVKMEAQRRLARISEGRPAKDGSTFTTPKNVPSAWAGSNGNGTSNGNTTNGGFVPVQPLDTFNAAPQRTEAPKPQAPSGGKNETWLAAIPSEEEQMEMLKEEEAWSTVKAKKPTKGKKDASGDESKAVTAASKPEQAAPTTVKPAVAKAQGAGVNGKAPKTFSQQSSFAALTPADEAEAEEEWDV